MKEGDIDAPFKSRVKEVHDVLGGYLLDPRLEEYLKEKERNTHHRNLPTQTGPGSRNLTRHFRMDLLRARQLNDTC